MVPSASSSNYRTGKPANPSHFPNTTSERRMGLVTITWMVPELISPASVSAPSRVAMAIPRKVTAYNPARNNPLDFSASMMCWIPVAYELYGGVKDVA